MAVFPPCASGASFLWQVPGGQLITATWLCDDQMCHELPEPGSQWSGPYSGSRFNLPRFNLYGEQPGLAFPPLEIFRGVRPVGTLISSLREWHQVQALLFLSARSALSIMMYWVIRPKIRVATLVGQALEYCIHRRQHQPYSHIALLNGPSRRASTFLALLYVRTCKQASKTQRCLTLIRGQETHSDSYIRFMLGISSVYSLNDLLGKHSHSHLSVPETPAGLCS